MTKEEIMALSSGKELDLLIATKVMGLVEGVDFGTFTEHDWKRDEDGEIDEWVIDSDYHNGPSCKRCHYSFCVNCKPKGYEHNECIVKPPSYSSGGVRDVENMINKIDGIDDNIRYDGHVWSIWDKEDNYIMNDVKLPVLICKYALYKVIK